MRWPQLNTDVDVILPVYAVLFLLALPLLRLRPRTLALLASALAIGGPVLSYLIRGSLHLTPASTPSAPGLSALMSWHALSGGIMSLVINGAYPVVTVLPITLAGMSVGRLDLSARSVQRWLLGVGATLSAVGYGGSALALRIGDLAAHIGSGSVAVGQQQLHDAATAEAGTVPTTSWAWLLTAGAHSGTPMEILGATGCALAVLGAALMIGNRAHRVLYPVIAVGMMPLTVYAAHVIAIWLIQAANCKLARPRRLHRRSHDTRCHLAALLRQRPARADPANRLEHRQQAGSRVTAGPLNRSASRRSGTRSAPPARPVPAGTGRAGRDPPGRARVPVAARGTGRAACPATYRQT